MAYIYMADIWCDACGQTIIEQIDNETNSKYNGASEFDYDSDQYPKYCGKDGGEADAPCHCGAGAECLSYEELSDGSKVGAFLRNPLTSDGYEYVTSAVAEAIQQGKSGSVALELWADEYDIPTEPNADEWYLECSLSGVNHGELSADEFDLSAAIDRAKSILNGEFGNITIWAEPDNKRAAVVRFGTVTPGYHIWIAPEFRYLVSCNSLGNLR